MAVEYASVIRRTTDYVSELNSGSLILEPGQWGYATRDKRIVIRDLSGNFAYLESSVSLTSQLFVKEPVQSSSELVLSDQVGTLRLVLDENSYWFKTKSGWVMFLDMEHHDSFGGGQDLCPCPNCIKIVGQIGSFCVHGKKITADMYLGRQGSLAENIGPPPEVVPFEVLKQESDHWEEHYSYTPKNNDSWQNLWDNTFWIWRNGKWSPHDGEGKWLPNTTTNTYSTGVTEGASLALKGGSSILMREGRPKIEMEGGAELNMKGAAKLNISGGVEVEFSGGAQIQLGGGVKLKAMSGNYAISGLQGYIDGEGNGNGNPDSNPHVLYQGRRVYKLKVRSFEAQSYSQEVADSFSLGDVFYFVAHETLEEDASVSYLNTDGSTKREVINKDLSLTLMLTSKDERGILRFQKLADTKLFANIFKLKDNATLQSEVGQYTQIPINSIVDVGRLGDLIPGKTLVYDDFGNLGIVASVGADSRPGSITEVTTIVTVSEYSNIPPFSFIRLKNDYELSDEVNETNQILLESFEMLTGNLPMQNRTLVNDKNGTLGIVTQIETLPWGDVVVTVVTISASSGKFDGTDKQIVLGNGEFTPEEGADGEVLNAASSLFSLGSRNNALRFVYGEFENRGGYIDLNSFLKIIGDGLVNLGYFQPPPGEMLIASISLSIIPPVNGIGQDDTVAINDAEPNYTTGNVIWLPDDSIFNGTKAYVAIFSIIADFDFKFDETTNIFVNGSRPTNVDYEEDGSLTITKNFAATMTALPDPSLTIAKNAGASTPTTISGTNYSGTINWTGTGNVFDYQPRTGTITLTAASGYRWNANTAQINNASATGILSVDGRTLTLTTAWTPVSIPTPSLSITEPAYGANRPGTATAQGNFANAIAWSPSVNDGKFPAGNNTGTFTLTANTGHIFGSNSLNINNAPISGSRTSNNTILTAQKIFNILNPNEGTFTDPRDGKVYGWKRMPDGEVWMTENLAYNQSGSWDRYDPSRPTEKAGRLYTCGDARSAVPVGWHLPTEAEWTALVLAAGGTPPNGLYGPAGKALKATSGWESRNNGTSGNGTDTYGFAAVPVGYREPWGAFEDNRYKAYWWSSTHVTNGRYQARRILYDFDSCEPTVTAESYGYSVRCIRNL